MEERMFIKFHNTTVYYGLRYIGVHVCVRMRGEKHGHRNNLLCT